VNARRALKTIRDTAWFEASVSTGDTSTFDITVPAGAHELRAMVYWTDKEAAVSAASALVNNIDMQLTDLTGSSTYNPWVLNTAPNATTLNNPATRGIDALNNVEQVTLDSPSAGDYRVSVYGSNIPNGPQTFYVVYYVEMEEIELVYPATEAMEPGTTTVRWDGATTGLTWEYSIDGGNTWTGVTGVFRIFRPQKHCYASTQAMTLPQRDLSLFCASLRALSWTGHVLTALKSR
jgi:hypothetical protein